MNDRQDQARSPVKQGRVANKIRALRTRRGLTQKSLAMLAGASRQTIVAVEAGKYAPSLELAFRIARVLGAPFESVFRLDGDRDWRPPGRRSQPNKGSYFATTSFRLISFKNVE